MPMHGSRKAQSQVASDIMKLGGVATGRYQTPAGGTACVTLASIGFRQLHFTAVVGSTTTKLGAALIIYAHGAASGDAG